MYADNITLSMRKAIAESNRRRKIQLEHNRKNHITPTSIKKAIRQGIEVYLAEEDRLEERLGLDEKEMEIREVISQLEKEMYLAAKNLQFEKAAQLRDKIKELKKVISDGKQAVYKDN
jgi:excinuclease ABC subunit B